MIRSLTEKRGVNRLRRRAGVRFRRLAVRPEDCTADVIHASVWWLRRGRAREYCVNMQMKSGQRALVCFTSRGKG